VGDTQRLRGSAAPGPPMAAGAARGAGTPSGAIHRGHTTETGNEEWPQPTATATKWRLPTGVPGKRGRTTASIGATHWDAHLGTVNWGSNPKGLFNRDSQPGTQLVGTQLVGTQFVGTQIGGDTHPAWAIHQGHTSTSRGVATQQGQRRANGAIHRDHPPHSGCGATHHSGCGTTHWDGAIRRGLTAGCQCSEPANDHPAGTHNRNSQRRMGPTKRNSHQATTASGGPTKRSHTTGTADRGHSQPGTQLVWRHIRPGPSIKDTQWRHPSGHNSKQLQVPPNRGSQRELQPGHQLGTHIPQPRRGHTIGTATRQQTGGSPNGDIHRGTPNSHRGHPPGTASRDSRRFAVLGAIRPGQPAGTARGDTHPERSGCGTTNCSGCGKRGGPQAGPSIGDIHRGQPSGTAIGDTQRGHPSGNSS
jgi:hypothetical protein